MYTGKKTSFYENKKTIMYLIYTKTYQDNNYHDLISDFAFKTFGHKPLEEKIRIKKFLKI